MEHGWCEASGGSGGRAGEEAGGRMSASRPRSCRTPSAAASLPRRPPSPVPCSCTSSPLWQHRVCTAAGLPGPASAPGQPAQARPAKAQRAQVPRLAQRTQTEPTGYLRRSGSRGQKTWAHYMTTGLGGGLVVACHVSCGASHHDRRHLRFAGGDARSALPCRAPIGSHPPAIREAAAWLCARRDSYRPRPRRWAGGRRSCYPGSPAARSRL